MATTLPHSAHSADCSQMYSKTLKYTTHSAEESTLLTPHIVLKRALSAHGEGWQRYF